jgi:hypothetical protein
MPASTNILVTAMPHPTSSRVLRGFISCISYLLCALMAVGIVVEVCTFFDAATYYNALYVVRPDLTYWVDSVRLLLEVLRLEFKAWALFWNLIWTLYQSGVEMRMYEVITHEWVCVLVIRTPMGVVGFRFGVKRDNWFGWSMCL